MDYLHVCSPLSEYPKLANQEFGQKQLTEFYFLGLMAFLFSQGRRKPDIFRITVEHDIDGVLAQAELTVLQKKRRYIFDQLPKRITVSKSFGDPYLLVLQSSAVHLENVIISPLPDGLQQSAYRPAYLVALNKYIPSVASNAMIAELLPEIHSYADRERIPRTQYAQIFTSLVDQLLSMRS